MRRMVVEDQLDRRTGRVSGIEKLEKFDELTAAVTLLDQGMDLPGEQINSGQEAERAMALVLIIARECRVGARHRRQIRCCRSNRLDSRLLVVGDDRHRLAWFLRLLLRLGSGLFQDLDLAIDAQNLRHLLLELGIAAFQIVTHLMRLDFLLAKNLAHRALDEIGETFVPRRRPVLARMACQQPRRPQLVRIAQLLRLAARLRHQPGLRLRRDRRFLSGPRPVIERHQRPISQRPLDAALHRLMMHAQPLSHRKKLWLLAISQKHLRTLHPARRFGSRARNGQQPRNVAVIHRQLDRLPPSCHDTTPRSVSNEESTNLLPVPSRPVSWNRSSSMSSDMTNASLPNSRDSVEQDQFLTILSREDALKRFEAALFPRAVPSEPRALA